MTAMLQLPTLLGIILIVLGTIALGVVPFIAVRRLLVRELPSDSSGVADAVAVRVGAVHGLILALVFAEAQATHADLRQEVSREITSLEHVAANLGRWDRPDGAALRKQLADYITVVLEKEWAVPMSPHGSPDARRASNALALGLLELGAETPREQTLRTQMIQDMTALQDHRKNRLSLTHRSLPPLFWWVALAGFAITVALFFVFPAQPLHVSLLAVYGAYTGLVLYFTLALSHPYIGPAAIDTSGYALVLDEVRSP